MSLVVLDVREVSKKFCRTLKKSMWYGIQDVFRDSAGKFLDSALRPDEFWAVKDVSFQLQEGECLGLIGANGAGKSTLLKMLNGILRPDKGLIRIHKRVGALIELGAGFHPMLTGRENIYINASILGMSKDETNKKFDEIVAFAGVGDFLDAPVKHYSSGMFVRLGMAVAVHTNPGLLLIDEVLAVGDMEFQAKCFNKIGEMRRQGAAFVFVSHNLHHVIGFSDSAIVLDHGEIHACGKPAEMAEKYTELLERRHSVQNQSVPNFSYSSGRVRLSNPVFLSSRGDALSVLQSSESFKLSVDYEALEDFKNLELDVVIYDGKNEVFFQGSNLSYRQTISLEKGKGHISVVFPCLPMKKDCAHFTLALWSENRHELLDWKRDLYMKIESPGVGMGKVWLSCSYDVEPQRGASN